MASGRIFLHLDRAPGTDGTGNWDFVTPAPCGGAGMNDVQLHQWRSEPLASRPAPAARVEGPGNHLEFGQRPRLYWLRHALSSTAHAFSF